MVRWLCKVQADRVKLVSNGKKHDNCLFVAQQKITQISLNAGDTDILFIVLSVELGCSSSCPKELHISYFACVSWPNLNLKVKTARVPGYNIALLLKSICKLQQK